jgi:WD40 repeat protein
VIRVWDIATGRLIAGSTEWPAVPCRATVSPDGHISAELVVQGSHGELAISDAATGQRITTLADNHTPAWSGTGLLATLGGNRIATPHGSMGMERTVAPGVTMGGSRVRVWRVKNVAPSYKVGEIVRELSVSDRGVTANGGEQRPPAGLLATSPACRRSVWAVGTPGKPDRAVELRDAQTGERVAMLDAINRVWPDGRAAFSPDGALLVVQEPHTVNDLKIFDPGSGKLLRTVPMNSMRQRAFAFLSARRTVSVGSGVRITDLDTGRIVARWDAGTMEAQDRAVAASSTLIATAGEDHKIHLWTLDGNEITRWTAHSSEVTALTFDATGKVLYSGAEDGSLRVWDLGRMRAESARLEVSW